MELRSRGVWAFSFLFNFGVFVHTLGHGIYAWVQNPLLYISFRGCLIFVVCFHSNCDCSLKSSVELSCVASCWCSESFWCLDFRLLGEGCSVNIIFNIYLFLCVVYMSVYVHVVSVCLQGPRIHMQSSLDMFLNPISILLCETGFLNEFWAHLLS